MTRRDQMCAYTVTVLICCLCNGFVTNNMMNTRFLNRARNTRGGLYMSDLVDSSILTSYGSDDNDMIRLLSNEKTRLLLEMWTMNPEWETREMRKMSVIANRDDPKDIFLAYAPNYNEKSRIQCLFLARAVVKKIDEDKLDVACLMILSGVFCPFAKGQIDSYKFKSLVQQVIPIFPIDFTALLKKPHI